jgi:hypothetical protein
MERDGNGAIAARRYLGRDGRGDCAKRRAAGGPFLFVASPGRDEIIYIPGTGMISTTSIHAPGIWKWGWSLPNILVAASADWACTIE